MSIMPLSEFSGEQDNTSNNRIMRWRERYYRQEAAIATLKAQRDELLELLKWADAKLGPEINPSNYDHQDVCELNANMVEVTLAIRAAIANAEKDKT